MRSILIVLVLVAFATLADVVQADERQNTEVLILRDDFEKSPLEPTDWKVSANAGADVRVDLVGHYLILGTDPAGGSGPGIAVVSSTKRFSVLRNTLIFRSRVLTTYTDHAIYGDAQPRGLVAGTDRRNAIEFATAYPLPNSVMCRTVAGGNVTETKVDIGQPVDSVPNVYQIVAKSSSCQRSADFYINGVRVATHTTNIPIVPLNVYFSTSDGGFQNVPVAVDWVSFDRIPQ